MLDSSQLSQFNQATSKQFLIKLFYIILICDKTSRKKHSGRIAIDVMYLLLKFDFFYFAMFLLLLFYSKV